MSYYVYILACFKKGKFSCFYTGQTNNFKRRMQQHYKYVREKQTKHFTGRFDFVKWVWYKKVNNRAEAYKLEQYIKSLHPSEREKLVSRDAFIE